MHKLSFLTFKVSLFAINQLLTLYKSLFSFTSMSAGELQCLIYLCHLKIEKANLNGK